MTTDINAALDAAKEFHTQVAYAQIAKEKMLTMLPVDGWDSEPLRAHVPVHWREEAEARAKPHWQATQKALRPVVGMHREVKPFPGSPRCVDCDTYWPCPTIRAITTAFEAGEVAR